jgi:eukaryotic-like serine/threonine-protein kinase
VVTVDSDLVAGRYLLVREVGRGGMGAVYLAHDQLLGRDVALKRIGQFQGQHNQARVEREAQLAARLSHPNVVTVFDLAEDGETRWLVMEYVEGTTLSRLAAARGGLPADEAAAILRQAAEALRVAHDAGIVHRDVKPSNLIVTADGRTKLADFGIARGAADDTLTATGILTGSPAYLAPEVASGGLATPASDIWSLGGTLFQAMTGRPPYDLGENVVAGLVKIVHDDPPRLPVASGPLATVLAATMVKEPERRWTAAQVCAFLDTSELEETRAMAPLPSTQQVASPPPPLAGPLGPPPGSAPARPARPARAPRRRTGVLWPVAGVVLLVVLVAGAWLVSRTGDDGSPGAGGSPATPASTGSATSPATATTSTATALGMSAFITDYLATVTDDPQQAWTMLTPAFQQASGGFQAYRSFWAPVSSAKATKVSADPDAMTVTYRVTYDAPKGYPKHDDVTLRLTYASGSYRIDGEPK